MNNPESPSPKDDLCESYLCYNWPSGSGEEVKNVCLFVYLRFNVPRIFHLYGDVTISGEGLQNLGECSALRAFEQGGIFIVPHLL
jgi:hypothetical protein